MLIGALYKIPRSGEFIKGECSPGWLETDGSLWLPTEVEVIDGIKILKTDEDLLITHHGPRATPGLGIICNSARMQGQL